MTHQLTMTLMLHLNDAPLESSKGDACIDLTAPTTTALWRKNGMPCPYCHVDHNPTVPRR